LWRQWPVIDWPKVLSCALSLGDRRQELTIAHKMLTDCGMEAFAERARVDLQATGQRARKRTARPFTVAAH
jgi:hypothetical protein